MWFAVCQGDICGAMPDKELLEKTVDDLAREFPDLFYREYISIISEEEYREEFNIQEG